MTDSPSHIAGDWGTTHLRLHLCRGATVLDKVDGAGIDGIGFGTDIYAPGRTAAEVSARATAIVSAWQQARGSTGARS